MKIELNGNVDIKDGNKTLQLFDATGKVFESDSVSEDTMIVVEYNGELFINPASSEQIYLPMTFKLIMQPK